MTSSNHKKGFIPLFYFSGTGNTWWASQRIREGLNGKNFCCEAYSIEQISTREAGELVSQAAIVGLGFPIYGSDAPRIFHAFLDGLPKQEADKPVLGYVTQLAWSGDGCNFLYRKLLEKGYRIRWAIELNMPNNIALGFSPLKYSADYESFRPKLEKCEAIIEKLCGKVARDEGWRQHSGALDAALAWMQRGPFRWAHDWGRKFWSVDAEKCTSCGICARNCPVGNIRMADGLPEWNLKCVYCMRCFNYCPELAVRYMNFSNARAERNPPFRGPVPEFDPGLVRKK